MPGNQGRNNLLAVGALIAFVVIMAFALAPNRDEQGAMRERQLLDQAQMLASQGDAKGGVRLLEPIVAAGGGDTVVVRQLLRFYQQDNRVEEHAKLVLGKYLGTLPAGDLRAARALYINRGMQKEANDILAALARRGESNVGEAVAYGQVQLATDALPAAAATARSVAQKLAAGEDGPAAAFVAGTLARVGDRRGTEEFIGKWLSSAPTLKSAMAVAMPLVQGGRADIAVPLLATWERQSSEARGVYVFGLQALAAETPALRSDVTPMLLGKLATAADAATATSALYDALAFGDLDLVADDMVRTGAWRTPAVRSGLKAALLKSGRGERLRAMLLAEANQAGATDERRRAIARELLEARFAGDAENILKEVAAREGPQGPAVNDLLYVWGVAGKPIDAAWFGQRARQADDPTAAAWIAQVAAAGSPGAAVAAIDAIEAAGGSRAQLTVMKVRYLAWQGDSPALRRALDQTAGADFDADATQELANIACQVGDEAATVRLAARSGPGTKGDAARRCATQLLVVAANTALSHDEAPTALEKYALAAASDDGVLTAQNYFDYANVLTASGDKPRAAENLQMALARLPEPLRDGPEPEMLRAAILIGMERRVDAESALEALLDRWPGQSRARVMIGELSLARNDFIKALSVATPPKDTERFALTMSR